MNALKHLLALIFGSVALLGAPLVSVETIDQQIVGKTYTEISAIKSDAISKYDMSGTYAKGDLTVEIVGPVERIQSGTQSGIQIFARAWKGGKQLGFGDGSVDIERFRIWNPPVMVDDPQGTIVRNLVDAKNGLLSRVRTLREDPVAAIKETLAHTIKIAGKEGTMITPGKVGNTTDTFFPDAGKPGTTSVDGNINNYGQIGTYASAHDAATASNVDVYGTAALVIENYITGANTYYIGRILTNFDTSTIGTDSITSATYSLYNYQAGVTNGRDSVSIVTHSITSNVNYATTDFGLFGTTKQATDLLDTSLVVGAYNDFTLNATGIASIAKTGVTKFAVRTANDVSSTAPVTSPDSRTQDYFSSADVAGTTQDPKLVVVHSAAATARPLQAIYIFE